MVLFLQSFGNDYSQSRAILGSQVGSGKGTGGRALGTQRSGEKCLIEVRHLKFYKFFSLHYFHLLLKELILTFVSNYRAKGDGCLRIILLTNIFTAL